jgi:hypothetical protein
MFIVCNHLIQTITLVDKFGVYPEFVGLKLHVNPPTFWNIHVLGTDVGVIAFLVAFLRQSQLLGREGSQLSKTLEESHLRRLTRRGILPTRDTDREGTGRSREDQLERGHHQRRVYSGIVRKSQGGCEFVPIELVGPNISPEGVQDRSIEPVDLPVGLGVIRGREDPWSPPARGNMPGRTWPRTDGRCP